MNIENIKKIGFIGLGLIGGSIAKAVRRISPDIKLYAVSGHLSTITAAYKEGVIENDRQLELAELADMDYIFLCTPVQQNLAYLKQLKQILTPKTILTDVGSVKGDIHRAVTDAGLEEYFIGGHPMAGSEKTGYGAATPYLLENAYYVITPTAKTSPRQTERFRSLVSALGAIPIIMDYDQHDFATASISHLPHIIAYSLVNLVKEIDDPAQTMKTIAAGGFRDMTRIAASSPVMWQDICLSNKQQLLHLMDLYVKQLSGIRSAIESEDKSEMTAYFTEAKNYRDSLAVHQSGPIQTVYELYCDLIDEVGGIATIAALLASNSINIKNIGILHNREYEDGVLHIELYDQKSLEAACLLLEKYHYTIYHR
ncbi:MAG: prephenate dehydrogenase [Eubacterium sp.]|nr:prephenate dehydrogenase [Eubacterium sp.]MCI8917927.1 prephenate dehydrogenase [Eubacterium sp.]